MSWATNQSLYKIHTKKGRVDGSSQWAPALDWSRHNYHVNILRIRWYNTHTLSWRLFPHLSQGTNTLWWVSFGAMKELKRVWRRNERHKYWRTLCTVIYPFYWPSNRPKKACDMHPWQWKANSSGSWSRIQLAPKTIKTLLGKMFILSNFRNTWIYYFLMWKVPCVICLT